MKKSVLVFTSILIVFCYSLPSSAAFKSEYKVNCNLAENTAWGKEQRISQNWSMNE